MLLRSTFTLLVLSLGTAAYGQGVLAAPYAGPYTLTNLGSAPGVPTNYGGICFLNNNTLLLGGAANGAAGAIYQVSVVRNAANQITGFSGVATKYKNSVDIDGGLTFGTGGVLFAVSWPSNKMYQYKPGSPSMNPDKTIDLTVAGVASSTGCVQFVSPGFPGAGGIVISSFSTNKFYTGTLTPDGMGTYDLSGVTLQTTIAGGPNGIVYVPAGSPVFNPANKYMVVCEWSADLVSAYQLDPAGFPMLATRQTFVQGLTGAEGAVLDPLTNDFLFSTFGGSNKVVRVSGFVTPPAVAVVQPGGSTNVTEGGATDTITVALTTVPTANVTITLNPGTQVTVAPASLTFTPANFNVPQTVTVTAVDDAVVEGPHTGTISFTAASADAAYNGIAVPNVIVNITDNDLPGPGPGPAPGGGGPEGAFGGTNDVTGPEGSFSFRSGRMPTLLGPFLQHPNGGLSFANLQPGTDNLPWPGATLLAFNVAHSRKAGLTKAAAQSTTEKEQSFPACAAIVSALVLGLMAVLLLGRALRAQGAG